MRQKHGGQEPQRKLRVLLTIIVGLVNGHLKNGEKNKKDLNEPDYIGADSVDDILLAYYIR